MTRSGYDNPLDDWSALRWRSRVAFAIADPRGQAFLRAMRDGMDAMPIKHLIADVLIDASGKVCALGAGARQLGIDISKIDPTDPSLVAASLGIAYHLAAEVAYRNDECGRAGEMPEERWLRMRDWIAMHIRKPIP